MAQQPLIPLQQGGNLSALAFVENEKTGEPDVEKETEMLAEALGLEIDDVEEEVIEQEDGSVIVNYTESKKPSEDPEFYANMAEELPESVLDELSNKYLELIDRH